MTKKEFLEGVGKFQFSIRLRRMVQKFKFSEADLDLIAKNSKLRKIPTKHKKP